MEERNARNAKMVKLYQQGLTIVVIAERFNCGAECVRAALRKHEENRVKVNPKATG